MKKDVAIEEIVKEILRRKIIIGITCVLLFAMGLLATRFILNPSRGIYSSSFELKFEGVENNKMPDGSIFRYQEIINLELLEEIVDQNSEFKNIKYEDMYYNDKIEISQDKIIVGDIENIIPGQYTITVSSSYFSNSKQGGQFVKALIEHFEDEISKNIDRITYGEFEILLNNVINYEDKINLLMSQRSSLLSILNDIKNKNGDIYVNDRRISSYIDEIELTLKTSDLTQLLVEIENKDYVNDIETERINLLRSKMSLEKQLVMNNNTIEECYKSIDKIGTASNMQSFSEYNQLIVSLIQENESIEQALIVINNKLLQSETKSSDQMEFEIELAKMISKVADHTLKVESVQKSVYHDITGVMFDTNRIIQESGTISSLLAGIIFALVGCVGLSVVIVYIYVNKKQDEEI